MRCLPWAGIAVFKLSDYGRSHRFAWPHHARLAGERYRPLQFSVHVLPARNGSSREFLPWPLGEPAAIHTDCDAMETRWQILTFEEIERVVRIAVELGHSIRSSYGWRTPAAQGFRTAGRTIGAIPWNRRSRDDDEWLFFQTESASIAAMRDCAVSASVSIRSIATISKRLPDATASKKFWRVSNWRSNSVLNPVKVNAVIIRGINDHEIDALADFARGHSL